MNLLHTVFWYLLITFSGNSIRLKIIETMFFSIFLYKSRLLHILNVNFYKKKKKFYFIKKKKKQKFLFSRSWNCLSWPRKNITADKCTEYGWFYFECNNSTSERCVFLADSFVRFDGCCSISVIERVPKKGCWERKKHTHQGFSVSL